MINIYFYLILYSVARYFIEGLRTDSLMLGLLVAQLISIISIIGAVIIDLIIRRKNNKYKPNVANCCICI